MPGFLRIEVSSAALLRAALQPCLAGCLLDAASACNPPPRADLPEAATRAAPQNCITGLLRAMQTVVPRVG